MSARMSLQSIYYVYAQLRFEGKVDVRGLFLLISGLNKSLSLMILGIWHHGRFS